MSRKKTALSLFQPHFNTLYENGEIRTEPFLKIYEQLVVLAGAKISSHYEYFLKYCLMSFL